MLLRRVDVPRANDGGDDNNSDLVELSSDEGSEVVVTEDTAHEAVMTEDTAHLGRCASCDALCHACCAARTVVRQLRESIQPAHRLSSNAGSAPPGWQLHTVALASCQHRRPSGAKRRTAGRRRQRGRRNRLFVCQSNFHVI